MGTLILLISFGLPLLVVAVLLFWFLGKPAREMRALEARAAAGDPEAKAALARAKSAESAMRNALSGEDPERNRLMRVGKPGRAVIVDVRPMGLEISAGPVPTRMVEVVLTVEGNESSPVTVRDAVSELHLGRLLKGATVPVKVDPMNPQRVIVLWDTL